MNKKIFIYHHLGLGDHFHCNGVVRFLLENKFKNKKVYLFAKKKYSEMIKLMYRDISRLEVISITDDENKESEEIKTYLKYGDHIEKIGFDYFVKKQNKNMTIDMIFYDQYNIDYSKRFELTYWKRDYSRENELYSNLAKNKSYAFVHDDPSRGFVIPDKLISSELQVIRNSNKNSIFDYAKIIENAKEIHVMESSIRCMLEYLNTKNAKHFLYDFDGPWKSIPFYDENNNIVGSSKKWKFVKLKIKKKQKFIKRIINKFISDKGT